MLLTRLLNDCHRFPGFVYHAARLNTATKTVEVDVGPRKGSKARCSCCQRPAPGYDQLAARRFEFIPIWGYAAVLIYVMRRVACRRCGVKVEVVPWAEGKHTLSNAYMLYLARWARKLSWKKTARSFRTSWEKVFHAVEFVVQWGLQQRSLDALKAIGVDEIQYGRGHQYLTLVYQLDEGSQRLIWVGKERTTESFEQFFRLIGKDLSEQIEFVCSDMWKPYLKLLKHCTNALNILDRFHIVVKMNLALDKVPASEASRMAAAGYEPVLTKSRGSDRTNACLNLAFRLVTITHHQGAPLFVLTTLELLQQLAQLCLQGLRDQRPGTVAQQLGQLIPSSLSTGKIDHVILFHSGVSHQLVWLCRNSHFNQIRRYPSTRPNTTFDHSSIVECHGLTGELLNF